MAEEKWQVVLEGSVDGHVTISEVAAGLAALSSRPLAEITPLLQGIPRVIKKGIDLETALRYQKAISNVGARCRVEEMGNARVRNPSLLPAASNPPPVGGIIRKTLFFLVGFGGLALLLAVFALNLN